MGRVGVWLESFDICGLPLPLWNHFSLAGAEEAASGRPKVKAKAFFVGVRERRSSAVDFGPVTPFHFRDVRRLASPF